jgi:tRNA 2-thiouridine synthesizing protein A
MDENRDNSIDRELDITTETCPMTFVRTRLALDSLPSGALLRVRLRGEEPRLNVPRTATAQGHRIVATETVGDVTVVTIRKA